MSCPARFHFLSHPYLHCNEMRQTVFARDHVSLSAEGSDCVASSPLRPAGPTPSGAELKMKYFLNKD